MTQPSQIPSDSSAISSHTANIVWVYGAMFSNKTRYLLDVCADATTNGVGFQVFNPATNFRDGATVLTDQLRTRAYPATVFRDSREIITKMNAGVKCVILEELNFADACIVDVVKEIHARDIDVFGAFLDKTAEGNYFPLQPHPAYAGPQRTTLDLLKLATIPPIFMRGTCAYPIAKGMICADSSIYSRYLHGDKGVIKVGGGADYMPCCEAHWKAPLNPEQMLWHNENVQVYENRKAQNKKGLPLELAIHIK